MGVSTTYPVDATGPEGAGPQYQIDFDAAPSQFSTQVTALLSAAQSGGTSWYAGRANSYAAGILSDNPLHYFQYGTALGIEFAESA